MIAITYFINTAKIGDSKNIIYRWIESLQDDIDDFQDSTLSDYTPI